MSVSRRGLLAGLGAAGGLAAFSACGDAGGSTGSAPVASDVKPTGEITFLSALFEGASGKDLLEGKLIPKFRETYPEVTVKVDYTTYANLQEKITTGLASGMLADIITLGVGWVEPFAHRKAVAELPADFSKNADYAERSLAPGKYENKQYTLPLVMDTRMVLYRKDHFAAAGITKTPASFAELREASKQLVQRTGTTINRVGFDPFSVDTRQLWTNLLFARGGKMFSEDGKQVAFNSSEGVDALQFLLDLVKDGSASFEMKTATGAPTLIQQGKASMMVANNSLWVQLEKEVPDLLKDDKLGMFLLQDKRKAMFQGGSMLGRSATTKNAAAAQAFIKFLCNADNVLAACEQRGAVPPAKEAQSSAYAKRNKMVEFALQNMEHAVWEGGTAAWMGIRERVKPTLETAIVGQRSAQAAIEDLTNQAKDAISRL